MSKYFRKLRSPLSPSRSPSAWRLEAGRPMAHYSSTVTLACRLRHHSQYSLDITTIRLIFAISLYCTVCSVQCSKANDWQMPDRLSNQVRRHVLQGSVDFSEATLSQFIFFNKRSAPLLSIDMADDSDDEILCMKRPGTREVCDQLIRYGNSASPCVSPRTGVISASVSDACRTNTCNVTRVPWRMSFFTRVSPINAWGPPFFLTVRNVMLVLST